MKTHAKHALALALVLSACGSQNGLRGDRLNTTFEGVDTVQALSPTAIKLSWTKSDQYSVYKIYQKGSLTPVATETFSSHTMSGLEPGRSYTYAVTGMQITTNKEDGFDYFKTATTFPNFDSVTTAGVIPESGGRVTLRWNAADTGIVFDIFVREQVSGTWDLSHPALEVDGLSASTVTGLTSGKTYCFLVVAHYLDGTSEPDTSDLTTVNVLAPCVTALP
jgi:hypothetical protein